MIADFDTYLMAKRLIDHCGQKAPRHADWMMRRFMAKNDPEQAADWLAIGVAIDQLQNLPALACPH